MLKEGNKEVKYSAVVDALGRNRETKCAGMVIHYNPSAPDRVMFGYLTTRDHVGKAGIDCPLADLIAVRDAIDEIIREAGLELAVPTDIMRESSLIVGKCVPNCTIALVTQSGENPFGTYIKVQQPGEEPRYLWGRSFRTAELAKADFEARIKEFKVKEAK